MLQCVKGKTGKDYEITASGNLSGNRNAFAGLAYSIPLSELEDVHGYTFAEPIAVEGEFVNRAGIVTLNYQVSCRLDAVCDRCLKPFTPSFSYTFSHTVVPSLHSDNPAYDAYLVAENDKIDLNETAISDLLLMLPTKLLCREDCKGLCDICGCDRNVTDCDCLKEKGGANDGCTEEERFLRQDGIRDVLLYGSWMHRQ